MARSFDDNVFPRCCFRRSGVTSPSANRRMNTESWRSLIRNSLFSTNTNELDLSAGVAKR